MPSRKPATPPDPSALQQALDALDATTSQWQECHQCTLVTPLFGGGVKPGTVDAEMPIRAASIRGQLRFWWRIACGPFQSSADMFAQESAIWGGFGKAGPKASKVKLAINCPRATAAQLTDSASEKTPAIKYAFGPATIAGPVQWLKPGYSFELKLRYPPELTAQIQKTLQWWASFGGIGARTRRGFGCVRIDGMVPLPRSEIEQAGARLAFAAAASSKAEDAWKTANDRLYAFRQKPGTARRAPSKNGNQQQGNRPGRSFWPEPDQLRRFTATNGNGRHPPVHPAGNTFPRAAFGLPIIFDFRGSLGDPPKLELTPEGDANRMASPLILRPYWNGKTWQAAALLLPGWGQALQQRLKLSHKGNRQHHQPLPWPQDPAEQRAKAQHIAPMRPPTGTAAARAPTDPLSAFMDFFQRNQ